MHDMIWAHKLQMIGASQSLKELKSLEMRPVYIFLQVPKATTTISPFPPTIQSNSAHPELKTQVE